jgi:hypothetical protein
MRTAAGVPPFSLQAREIAIDERIDGVDVEFSNHVADEIHIARTTWTNSAFSFPPYTARKIVGHDNGRAAIEQRARHMAAGLLGAALTMTV